MAERPVWPAVLVGGWRSRPGVVCVAAVLLVLFGLLLVLVEAGEGQLEVVVVVTGLGRVSKVGVSCEMLPAWDEET
jgi:hypothetical protein